MALETLSGKTTIGGYAVNQVGDTGTMSEMPVGDNVPRFITIDHNENSIKFVIQNGPIKEVGVTGCQVDTMAETVKLIIEGLNKNFPSPYNQSALTSFTDGINHLAARTKDRTTRGVEGTSQA